MRKQLIESIKTGEVPDDEIFIAIFEIPDELERQRFIEELRIRARDQKVLTTFNSMLKQWTARKAQEEKQLGGNRTRFTDAPLVLNCGRWEATDAGVTKYEPSRKAVACTHPILPVERLVNIDTNTEKLKLAFFKDERWQYVTVDCTTVYNKQNITVLGDRGVMVTSETARDLVKYLSEVVSLNMTSTSESKAIPLYKSISRLGWVDGNFCPYIEGIKYDGDQEFEKIYSSVRPAGDRELWYQFIGKIRKNQIARILIATSLCSPLIELVGALPFMLHLWGESGFGKTVTLFVAMSVWGNPRLGHMTHSLKNTGVFVGRTAAFLRNLPFAMDELQQVKDSGMNWDGFVMHFTEGIDKGRGTARGGIEASKVWHNCAILTAEETLTKDNSGAGVKNRVIEIEVTEKIFDDPNEAANLVKENYGWAGKEFIEFISGLSVEYLQDRFKAIAKDIMETCDTTDKQAYSMACILLADELSCQSIFECDAPLRVEDVAQYLHSVKSVDIAERAYEWVINWIAQNENRFVASSGGEVWGKINKAQRTAMVNKKVLEEHMHANGFEYKAVKKKWDKKGYLVRGTDGCLRAKATVNGVNASYININLDPEEHTDIGVIVAEPVPSEFVEQEIKWQ